MQKWLAAYENSRHSKNPGYPPSKEPNESWSSSKYGAMEWREAQQIYLPSLNMCVGPAWNKLKRLWRNYKRNGRTGQYRSDIAYEIVRYQAGLDIPRSDLPELEGISDYEFGDSDQETNERPEEWSMEDEILLREEKEAKDDWWISDN